jgi:hypothetical protein
MRAPTRPTEWRRGLSLIELLTSVSIALAISVVATVTFIQVRTILLRMQVRLDMHDSARFIFQAMSDRFAAMQQHGACWIETTQNDGSGDGQVTFTYLEGKADEHDFTTTNGDYWNGEQDSQYQNRCTDMNWAAWHWDQKKAILFTGTTSPPRQFMIHQPWLGPLGDYQGMWMANMPQPLRQATPYPDAVPAGSSQAALSGNRYGSPDIVNDFSDYQDLEHHLSPAVRNVSGFTIELVMSDGSVIDADVRQNRTLPYDGCYVDAHTAADIGTGTVPFKKRPRLIRVLIDMTDPVTGVSQSFSFSFQPPGMLPVTYPAGNAIP